MRLHDALLLFVLVAAFSILLALNASAIVFDDGDVHVIDVNNSYPLEPVEVLNGPGGLGTTLSVLEGGSIATLTCDRLEIRGLSAPVIFGGQIGCLSVEPGKGKRKWGRR